MFALTGFVRTIIQDGADGMSVSTHPVGNCIDILYMIVNMKVRLEKRVPVSSDKRNIEGVRYQRPALCLQPLRAGFRRFSQSMSGERKEMSKG